MCLFGIQASFLRRIGLPLSAPRFFVGPVEIVILVAAQRVVESSDGLHGIAPKCAQIDGIGGPLDAAPTVGALPVPSRVVCATATALVKNEDPTGCRHPPTLAAPVRASVDVVRRRYPGGRLTWASTRTTIGACVARIAALSPAGVF